MQNPRRMVLVSLWCGLFLVSSTGWAREGSTVVPAPLARGGGASAELMASMTETKLDASGAQPLDYFGGAVSIDGSTAVVGASAGFNPAFNDARGKVYVFSRDQGGAGQWGEVKKLVADDAADGDFFGIAVSMSGDTIAVGSLTDVDDALSPSGAVYLFERNAGGPDNWGQVKKLTNGLHYGNFGHAVAISGDTLVVGARGEGDGAAYVLSRDVGGAGNWGEVQRLTLSDPSPGFDNFGAAVAVDGQTAIVGAFAHDGAGEDAGSAYVFARDAGGADNWGEVKKLVASDAAEFDVFGTSVSIDADTVVVGAPHPIGTTETGAAYVFSRDHGGSGNWGEVGKLTGSTAASDDELGTSVAVSGDLVAVGAINAGGAGGVRLFRRDVGGADAWGEDGELTASDGALGDDFGFVAASSGTVLVGARFDDDDGGNSGSAYVYEQPAPSDTVVYTADQTFDGVFQLYGAPLTGGSVTSLSGAMPSFGDVTAFEISLDGNRAVYSADQTFDGVVEVYSVPLTGGSVTSLVGAMPSFGDVTSFAITPNCSHVVYMADQTFDGVVQVYSVPLTGGSVTSLSGAMPSFGDVTSFAVSPDSSRVVYKADQTFDGVHQVYSVPIAGGSTTSLTGAMPSFGDVSDFAISPDGSRVVYTADQTFDQVVQLYSVPATGGGVTSLSAAMPSFGDVRSFAITPDGSRVVYLADQTFDEVFQVYSVPVAGGGVTSLSAAMPSFGDVESFAITPDGSRVVYLADQTFDEVFQVYSVPVTGGGVANLSAAMPSFGDVGSFAVSPDGSRVVYLADQTFDEVFQIYSVPVTGGGVTSLSAAMPSFGDVTVFAISPDGGRVVYLADQTFDNIFQIYSAPLAGGGVASLSPGMPAFGDVSCFTISADGSRVVYGADQTFDGVVQAYSVPVQGGAGTNLGGAVPSFSDVNALEISPDSETVCGPGPECFLVIGDGPGDASFLDGHHMFETQVDDVEESHAVLLDDIPEFVLPIQGRSDVQIWGGKKGGPPAFVVGDVGDIPAETPSWMLDMSFAVQVLMWNPEVFPELPEQSTAGLQVTLLPNGGVSSTQYGESVGGLDIWHEVDVDESGRRVIRFPFDIPDL